MTEYQFSESHTIGEWCERLDELARTEIEAKKTQAMPSVEMALILEAISDRICSLLDGWNYGMYFRYDIEEDSKGYLVRAEAASQKIDYLSQDDTEPAHKIVTTAGRYGREIREMLRIFERPSMRELPGICDILKEKITISFNRSDAA